MVDETSLLRAALAPQYTLEHELGRGGMATVWLAQDRKLKRAVAIKVLRADIVSGLAERFLREVAIVAKLSHPHILPLFASGKAAGFLYFVMPYVAGETLRARLDREKQLSLDEVVSIAQEVADALEYADRHDSVHRDVKPENILFDEGHAVVAEFGVARAIETAARRRALAKAPADRWQPPSDFVAALTAAVSGPRPSSRYAINGSATIAIGVAAAVLGIAAVGLLRSRARAGNSVAVLCFHNLSRDTADAYLADGLTEEITARLGHLARLDVKSRIASSRYCAKAGYEPTAIGRALGVANLVNGSVRRDGPRLRVTVELVRSRNGDRLWGGEFDRANADLLDIEQDIATAVGSEIAGHLDPTEQASLT